jgi:hypothetical protein
MDYVVRFVAGGLIVSAFAILGDLLRPKSFATSEVDASFAAHVGSRRRDLHTSNWARTYGVRPGEDATGVKSGFWSLPTRMPE